jgi:hypothetical protein
MCEEVHYFIRIKRNFAVYIDVYCLNKKVIGAGKSYSMLIDKMHCNGALLPNGMLCGIDRVFPDILKVG